MSSKDVTLRPLTLRGEVVSQWDVHLPARPAYGDWRDQKTWPGKGEARAQGYAFLVGLLLFLVMVPGSALVALIGLLT